MCGRPEGRPAANHVRLRAPLRSAALTVIALIAVVAGQRVRAGDASAAGGTAAAIVELHRIYAIEVRATDAAHFVTKPLSRVPDSIEVTPMPAAEVPTALRLVGTELAKYPADFVRRTLGAIFLCDTVKSYGHRAGGLVFLSGIYLPGRGLDRSAEARHQFVLTLHHELSSLTLGRGGFPEAAWRQQLPAGFAYPASRVVTEAALEHVDDAAGSERAHADGFVNTYGKTSLENDFNTYAETAFGDPGRMTALAAAYPRMAGKLEIFLAFHETLDPRFAAAFKAAALQPGDRRH